MIVSVRAAARAVLLACFLGIWFILYYAGWLFCWSALARLKWRRFYVRQGARISLAILHAKVRVEGVAPAESSVVVCNHLGYVDILVLASVATVVFVSRSDVEGWAGVGPLAASAGTIFIDRGRRRSIPETLDRMRAASSHQGSVVFFPEGTSSDGTGLLPFRSSLFEVAWQVKAPVACAALAYETSDREARPESAVAWWEEDLDFLPHFRRLVSLSRFTATVRFLEPALDVADFDGRRDLCAEAERLVRAALTELRRSTSATRAS
jgi:lyso-ornithine lipid O-acyltransferase